MRLTGDERSRSTRRVRMFLAEKAIAIPIEPAAPAAGDQPAAGTAANGRAESPALILDDATVIAEPIAICRYFEGLRPQPPLFGRPGKEAALVELRNRDFEQLLAAHEAVPAPFAIEVDRTRELLRALDRVLEGNVFVVGHHFTVADITALIWVEAVAPAGLGEYKEFAHLRRWHALVSSRPSAS